MKDSKKLIIILISLLAFYSIYLYKDNILEAVNFKNFFRLPDRSENKPGIFDSLKENQKVLVTEEESLTINVVEETTPAVVSVVRKEVYFDPFRGPFRSEDSIGTGFVIKGDEGIVLTNKHVVDSDQATYSIVIGEGEKAYDVVNVYKDPLNDFAILKVDTGGEVLPELKLGDSDNIKVGQTVIAIGNALGQFGNSVTKGIVSGLKRGIIASAGPFGETEMLDDIIQTDAALNPGNSGGPLLNLQGEVIGINVAISQGAENIGFAIPINNLKGVIEQFYAQGKISRPYLGVEFAQITKEIAEQRSIPTGAFIRRVVEDSPAQKANIQPGDIILRINGIRLDDESNTLSKVISTQKVGETIDVVIDRNGKESTLKVTLSDLEE
jgi:serine protease Do